MAVDTKTAVMGVFLIGIVAMAGWVGFLYVNPVTKIKKETEEDTEYIYVYPPAEQYGIPSDWSDAPVDASFTIYNETGDALTVTLQDILDGVTLYNDEQTDPTIDRHTHKYEYMEVYTVQDPISGKYFTGVDMLDVLESKYVFYSWDLRCESNQDEASDIYINTGDICWRMDDDKPTIIAIAAEGKWLQDSSIGSQCGNFSIIGVDTAPVYDLSEIVTENEWEVKIYVNDTLQPFRVNRTNIEDPYNPLGWTYSYDKEVEKYITLDGKEYNTGEMTYNRTYWGLNMSYIVNQTSAKDYNFTLQAVSADGWGNIIFNNTDVHNGLSWPGPYSTSKKGANPTNNNGYTRVNSSNIQPLPETDKLMVLAYMEQKFYEYGLYGPDPEWEKGYIKSYHKGPFYLIIPGKTRNYYGGWVTEIRITSYVGPIP